MKKTILLMDNDEDFLQSQLRLLADEYEVLPAATVAAAEKILANRHIHLAILDIRMEDDQDAQDISGLMLAQNPSYRTIPKLLLTAYPSWDYAEKALGAALDGLQIVGMERKDAIPDALAIAVENAFASHVQINENLSIRWRAGAAGSFEHLSSLLQPGLAPDSWALRADQLEALFRRLFHDYSQVTVDQLFKHAPGIIFSGVYAYTEKGREDIFLLACGLKDEVHREQALFLELAPQVGEQAYLQVRKTAETTHFAATAYAGANNHLSQITTFAHFFKTRPIEQICLSIETIGSRLAGGWHRHGQYWEEEKTADSYFKSRLQLDNMEQETLLGNVQAICEEAVLANLMQIRVEDKKIVLQLDDETIRYPHPATRLFSPLDAEPVAHYLCGFTHGQLDGQSILVAAPTASWLIDYRYSQPGPLVYDFVSLESAIKFALLSHSNISEIYEMERRLTAVSSLNEQIDTAGLPFALAKAIQTICHIRRQAAKVTNQTIEPYLEGLFYQAIAKLAAYQADVRHTPPERIPYLHALLSATIICQHFSPKDLPQQALDSLWISETEEVWVEGKKVDLTGREFGLLNYLYQCPGEVCDRIDIAKYVFQEPFDDNVPDWQKREQASPVINATMTRLRKKVEPYPKKPKYIITERAKGYRLTL